MDIKLQEEIVEVPVPVPVEPLPLELIVQPDQPPRHWRFAFVSPPLDIPGMERNRAPRHRGSFAALDEWLLFRLSERLDNATMQHSATLFQLENTTRELQRINADIERLHDELQQRNERDRSPLRRRQQPEDNQ